MTSSKPWILSIAILLLCALRVLGQASPDKQQFNKDGLAFDYPAGWQLQDQSSADAQQLFLGRADSDVQISVFAYRVPAKTPEQVAEAKSILVDKYIDARAKQFEEMGLKTTRVPATSKIAGAVAEGVKLQAVMDGDPGGADIYWTMLGQRLVVLTFLGSDKSKTNTMSAWEMIVSSIKIEMPKPVEGTNKAKP